MATVTEQLELQTGDRMTADEFMRVYEQTPEDFKAELIGGIVYVASPLKRRHGTMHPALGTVFLRIVVTRRASNAATTRPSCWAKKVCRSPISICESCRSTADSLGTPRTTTWAVRRN